MNNSIVDMIYVIRDYYDGSDGFLTEFPDKRTGYEWLAKFFTDSISETAKEYNMEVVLDFFYLSINHSAVPALNILVLDKYRKVENRLTRDLTKYRDIYDSEHIATDDVIIRIRDEFISYMKNIYDKKDEFVVDHEAAAHNCPNCGAVLRKNQDKCDYCLTEFW